MGTGVLDSEEEEPLHGGFVNTVVRVGDTVRRSAGAWTPTVHRLLFHARERGLSWVPEPQGYDPLGREILSFIPGDVPHEMPAWVWSEVVLAEVARALRQWHDATCSFDRGSAVWNFDFHEPAEVICHNDFCSPGPRLWDIVYTAYRYVPLMPPADADVPDGSGERSPFELAEMRSRLDTFLAAYAAGSAKLRYSHDAVIDMAVARLEAAAAWTANHAAKAGESALENHALMYRAHAQWMRGRLRGESGV